MRERRGVIKHSMFGLQAGMSVSVPPQLNPRSTWKLAARWLLQWTVLFALWMAFSGEFIVEFMIVGALLLIFLDISFFYFHQTYAEV